MAMASYLTPNCAGVVVSPASGKNANDGSIARTSTASATTRATTEITVQITRPITVPILTVTFCSRYTRGPQPERVSAWGWQQQSATFCLRYARWLRPERVSARGGNNSLRRSVLDTREGHGPSASARGGGAPRVKKKLVPAQAYNARRSEGRMKKIVTIGAAAALLSAIAFAQPRAVNVKDIVELEMLTHAEVSEKIHNEGMTSVLIVTGGTEERGPHDILGGHTVMARHHAVEIAKKLGKTLVAPVLPIAVQATGLREDTNQPGGVQMPPDAFKAVQVAEIESMAMNGFKAIFLMGDHGDGQRQIKDPALAMDQKLSSKGVHVYYGSDFYNKTHEDGDMYLYEHKLPIGGHGTLVETSETPLFLPAPGAHAGPNQQMLPRHAARRAPRPRNGRPHAAF